MRKLILLPFILLCTISIKAQMFATPNSEWYYSKTGWASTGYANITLGGTVTINSKTCTQLNYYLQTYNYISASTNTFISVPYKYIHEANNVVYLFNQQSNAFDTLYNFNAVAGNKWLLPGNYTSSSVPLCNRTTLTVLSTGYKTIQGINLKWLEVSDNLYSYLGADTIYERIGFLKRYFFNYDDCTSGFDFNDGGKLRCFNDYQIINFNKTNQTCNYLTTTVSENEKTINKEFKIYPNPTNGILNIKLELQSTIAEYKIKITNTLGQIVQTTSIQNQTTSLNISELQNGIYFLQVFDKNKLIGTTKIVKE